MSSQNCGSANRRMGSGLTVGLFGQLVGVAPALGWSSAALLVGTAIAGAVAARGRRLRAVPV